MRVSQPRIVKLEKSEIDGSITLDTLERAAQAMGCRVAYVLIPERPLAETMREQAERMAEKQMAAVEQTMLLEAQSVTDNELRREAKDRLVQQFLQRPARLWDEP
jgi:predicted DNA-binding mobile mystery protein A